MLLLRYWCLFAYSICRVEIKFAAFYKVFHISSNRLNKLFPFKFRDIRLFETSRLLYHLFWMNFGFLSCNSWSMNKFTNQFWKPKIQQNFNIFRNNMYWVGWVNIFAMVGGLFDFYQFYFFFCTLNTSVYLKLVHFLHIYFFFFRKLSYVKFGKKNIGLRSEQSIRKQFSVLKREEIKKNRSHTLRKKCWALKCLQ